MSKVASRLDAVAELVRDGDVDAIEGSTHLISCAAGQESTPRPPPGAVVSSRTRPPGHVDGDRDLLLLGPPLTVDDDEETMIIERLAVASDDVTGSRS